MGMVTEFNLIEAFARRGMYTINEEQGIHLMNRLLGRDFPHFAVMDANWPLVCQSYSMGIVPPMVAHLAETETSGSPSGDHAQTAVSMLEQLARTDEPERPTVLADYLHDLVAKVLRIERSRFDVQQPLNTLGMDSMIAIELKNQIDHHLRVNVSVVDLLQGSHVMQLTSRILPQLVLETTGDGDEDDIEALLRDIEQLSDEEARQLLSVDADREITITMPSSGQVSTLREVASLVHNPTQ
ncbi:MAG: acyl carrier protein [Chloroflexaceae bacterium]|nr:acyl carrier protein [Chloroflexaceae bacterium]